MTKVDRDRRYHPLYALARDAERVKDPALASLGASLCERVLDSELARFRKQPAATPSFADAKTLVLSRFAASILAGAACSGYIARTRPDGTELLGRLMDQANARARMLLVRYAVGGPEDEVSRALLTRGLADRSTHVRREAAWRIQSWRSESLLPSLQHAISRERNASVRDFMLKCQSIPLRG